MKPPPRAEPDLPTPTKRSWRDRLVGLQRDVQVVAMALVHPSTPWLAKVVAAGVVVYAVSPIDLIPDPIPVLGQLDDLILVPLGVTLVLRLIPRDVIAECRDRAAQAGASETRPAWRIAGAVLVIVVWLVLLIACLYWLRGVVD